MLDLLNIDIKKTKCTLDNISTITDILLNCTFRFLSYNSAIIEFKKIDVIINFRLNGKIVNVVFKFHDKIHPIKNSIPYTTFEDLIFDFQRLNIELEYNKNHISVDNEFNTMYYFNKFNEIKGFTFTQTKNNITKMFLNGNHILSLIHYKERVKFENDINITEDYKKEIYKFISGNMYDTNLNLNNIRNNLYKNILDNDSHIKIDELILNIQSFFNNFRK